MWQRCHIERTVAEFARLRVAAAARSAWTQSSSSARIAFWVLGCGARGVVGPWISSCVREGSV
jgi:hypothetical protein